MQIVETANNLTNLNFANFEWCCCYKCVKNPWKLVNTWLNSGINCAIKATCCRLKYHIYSITSVWVVSNEIKNSLLCNSKWLFIVSDLFLPVVEMALPQGAFAACKLREQFHERDMILSRLRAANNADKADNNARKLHYINIYIYLWAISDSNYLLFPS